MQQRHQTTSKKELINRGMKEGLEVKGQFAFG